jgi:transposase
MGAKGERRRFSREFKLEAIRRALESGRPRVELARELGIHPEMLYRWVRDHRADPKQAFPGAGNLKERDREVEQLRREVERLKAELAFLKKVSAYFAKDRR